MPTTAPDSRLPVAVGVLRRRDDRLLLQQRLPGKPCAGQWEFPGGKIESGESPSCALRRELREELGVEVAAVALQPLLELPFDYAHASVHLAVFLVDFTGEAVGREGQRTCWLTTAEIRRRDILQAVHPILDALDDLSRPASPEMLQANKAR